MISLLSFSWRIFTLTLLEKYYDGAIIYTWMFAMAALWIFDEAVCLCTWSRLLYCALVRKHEHDENILADAKVIACEIDSRMTRLWRIARHPVAFWAILFIDVTLNSLAGVYGFNIFCRIGEYTHQLRKVNYCQTSNILRTPYYTLFVAANKQLYEWYFLSVCLSICHTFFPRFQSSYHHETFRSYYQYQWPKWGPCKRSSSKVTGKGHRGQTQLNRSRTVTPVWIRSMMMKWCTKLDVALKRYPNAHMIWYSAPIYI